MWELIPLVIGVGLNMFNAFSPAAQKSSRRAKKLALSQRLGEISTIKQRTAELSDQERLGGVAMKEEAARMGRLNTEVAPDAAKSSLLAGQQQRFARDIKFGKEMLSRSEGESYLRYKLNRQGASLPDPLAVLGQSLGGIASIGLSEILGDLFGGGGTALGGSGGKVAAVAQSVSKLPKSTLGAAANYGFTTYQ